MNELLKLMSEKDITCALIFERIKEEMCDNYCKYPQEYKADEDDANWDRLLEEKCTNCPLNHL